MTMITEKKVKQLETIESNKIDTSLFKRKSNAKTYPGLLIADMKKARDDKNWEMVAVIQHYYQKYTEFEKTERFQVEQWRGKSGVNFLVEIDRVIAERYRKNDINQKSIKVSLELSKQEINRVIWAINILNKGKIIETSEIAERVYNKPWKQVFSTRKEHIKLVEILNYLEFRKDIYYSRR